MPAQLLQGRVVLGEVRAEVTGVGEVDAELGNVGLCGRGRQSERPTVQDGERQE